MLCPRCGAENSDGLKLCGKCGASLLSALKAARSDVTETIQTSETEFATGTTFAGRYQVVEDEILFSARVCKVITFINVNFADPTSLQEICLAVNLSEQHATRIFKQEVGIPIKKFLIMKRLYEAARTLRSDPKASENYVLSYCGFDDVSNFIKQFKSYFGCSPLKFRNCNRDPGSCGLWKQSYFHLVIRKRKLREALGADISHPCALSRIKKKISSAPTLK